jgi:hypothetical protein
VSCVMTTNAGATLTPADGDPGVVTLRQNGKNRGVHVQDYEHERPDRGGLRAGGLGYADANRRAPLRSDTDPQANGPRWKRTQTAIACYPFFSPAVLLIVSSIVFLRLPALAGI